MCGQVVFHNGLGAARRYNTDCIDCVGRTKKQSRTQPSCSMCVPFGLGVDVYDDDAGRGREITTTTCQTDRKQKPKSEDCVGRNNSQRCCSSLLSFFLFFSRHWGESLFLYHPIAFARPLFLFLSPHTTYVHNPQNGERRPAHKEGGGEGCRVGRGASDTSSAPLPHLLLPSKPPSRFPIHSIHTAQSRPPLALALLAFWLPPRPPSQKGEETIQANPHTHVRK